MVNNNNLFDNIIVSNKYYLKKKKGEIEKIKNIEDIDPVNDTKNKIINVKNDIIINKYTLINSIEDITKIVLNVANSETNDNNCIAIFNDNLANLFVDIFPIYTPQAQDVKYENNSIKNIKIIIGDFKDNNSLLISRLSVKSANDSNIYITNIDTIINFYNCF